MKLEELELELQQLDLSDGDFLVVKVKDELDPEVARELGRTMNRVLPKGVRCFIADRSVEISTLKAADLSG